MLRASALWRRVDSPGHDACRLEELADGWRLEGAALFLHEGAPARLDYRLECDRDWLARRGEARGWIGAREVRHRVERAGGGWTLDGAALRGLERCLDLDFAFTPATNLPAVRRLALEVGGAAEAPAAWLDAAAGTLARLEQRYARRSPGEYAYHAPGPGYSGLLAFDADGFVRSYPGLWEREA